MKTVKKTLILGLVLFLCLVNIPCGSSDPPPEVIHLDGFKVALSEPDIEFPESITFDIEVESDAEISEITLHYRVDRLSALPVTVVAFPEFDPGTSVRTGWTWDLTRSGGLPPGAGLEYWWSVENVAGDTAETSPESISFDDGGHSWKSLASEQITILWYKGDTDFAGFLMDAAGEALTRLTEYTGTAFEGEANIYIYAGSQDLREALIYPQEWTGGVAFTEFGTIAIGVSPGNLDWGMEAVAHELSHLVIHQFVFNGYGVGLPLWLDEGLAMMAQGELSSGFRSLLEEAIEKDTLFSVKSLCGSFPSQAEEAYLAYAQSYSLVEYLLEEQGGRDKMLELLVAFRDGSGYVEALDTVYGLDIEQLDTLWREYKGVGSESV